MYNQGNNNTGWKISRTALGLRRWELVLGGVDLPVCAIRHWYVSCSVHARCLEARSGDAELSHAWDPLLVWARAFGCLQSRGREWEREQHHPAPGQAGRRCTLKMIMSCTEGDSLWTAFAIQSFWLSGLVFSLPMTSSPLSPFMCLFCILVSLRLICLPGFVLFLSFIKALLLPFSAFPFALLPPWSEQSSPHSTIYTCEYGGRGKGQALIKQAVNLGAQGIWELLLQASSQPHFSEELS